MSWDAVLIAGPTASGKSQVALELAEHTGGTVINADSMQVYSDLRILTARPSEEGEARAPHRLYGHVPVAERYSVGRYIEDAEAVLKEVRAEGRLPIFVGGTGLYFNALTQGLSPIPPVPAEVRVETEKRIDEIGLDAFFAEFAADDPKTAANLKPNDRQRILRAACVFEASGVPLAEWQETPGISPLKGLALASFVLAPPREELYARIEKRFGEMIADGAIEEAKALATLDPYLPAARALGLPQLLSHVVEGAALETVTDEAVMQTRRYAKRQMTWFRRFMADWKWLENDHIRNIIAIMSHNNA
jgi:tRNA dimethylallyltransferase